MGSGESTKQNSFKYCVIVGGSSEIAKSFIKSHCSFQYVLMDLDHKLNEICEFAENMNVNFIAQKIDVRKTKEIRSAFSELARSKIEICALIYLVGTNSLEDAFDVSEEIWDNIFSVNLRGCFFTMVEAAKSMIKNQHGGSIVNISSQHGIVVAFPPVNDPEIGLE